MTESPHKVLSYLAIRNCVYMRLTDRLGLFSVPLCLRPRSLLETTSTAPCQLQESQTYGIDLRQPGVWLDLT